MRKFCLVLLAVLIVAPVAVETYLRLTSKYVPPMRYVHKKGVGFVYDHEFSPATVNRLGFVDSERNAGEPGRTRVLLVGDSFVAGTSLASQLEKALQARLPDRKFEVIPMAFPGIGLGNMYAFVAHYGLEFRPSAVVAVFNSATFANNSPVLEAMKLRSHPRHPMRLFFQETAGVCATIPSDPDFQSFMLRELPSVRPKTLYTVLEDALEKAFGRFYAYNWLKDSIAQTDPLGFLRQDKEFAYRYSQLRSLPEFGDSLDGWAFPDDLDMNAMFWTGTEAMPPVFVQALDGTRCALRAFDDLGRSNGFKFLLAISDDCSVPNELMSREFRFRAEKSKRAFVEQGYKNKIVAIARETRTPFVDLYERFPENPLGLHYFNNIHWNEDGIKVAAKGIGDSVVDLLDKDQ